MAQIALRASVAAEPAVIVATLDVFTQGLSVVIGGRRYAAGGRGGLVYDTLRIERAVNVRPTCRLVLTLPSADLPARAPRDNEDVVVAVDQLRLFGGSVYETTTTLIRGTDQTHVRVVAVGYAARLDQRRIEGYVRTGENQPVEDLVRQLIHDHADGEGFTTRQVVASDLVQGDVYDYIPVSEALARLAEQSNSVWCVDPYRDLVFHARDAVQPTTITLDEQQNLARIVRKVDRQHWRNVQTVIGSTPAAGQRREDFTGDGTRREFSLQFRLDKIVQVSVNGASQGFSGDADPWTVDRARSVLVRRASHPPLGADASLEVVYNYNFPMVVTRENAASIAAGGRMHRVEQDAALDTLELVETRAEALLARHDFPTSVLDVETPPGAVVGLAEGTVVPVEIPSLGITGERWLVDRITITERTTHLVYRARLLARDHETLYEEFWDRLQRNTVPTELTRQQAPDQTAPIDPAVLGLEGLRLPVLLGGDYATRLRQTDWRAIPGATIARLNGRRLPSALVEWYATAQLFGTGTGEMRLFNRTSGTARGGVVTVSGTNAEVVFIRRITLSADLSDYELQARVTATPSSNEHGLSVWGAVLDVGD